MFFVTWDILDIREKEFSELMTIRSMTYAVFAIILLMLSGCATILYSSEQTLGISSFPRSAQYKVIKISDGGERSTLTKGLTPGIINIQRGEGYFSAIEYEIEVTLEGYEPVIIPLRSNFAFEPMIADFFLGIIPLLLIDPFTGAFYYYTEVSSGQDSNVYTVFSNRRRLEISIELAAVSDVQKENLVLIAQAEKK